MRKINCKELFMFQVTIFLTSFSTYKLTHAQMIEPLPQINEYYASLIQPNVPQDDQQAEGAVNVNFSPNNLGYFRFENRDVAFADPYVQTLPVDGAVSQEHAEAPKALGLRMNPNQPPSQSFNVGYSVKFGGLPLALRQITKQQQIFTDSDIITGKNKEEVMKPVDVINPVSEEFVFNNHKKHNKVKYHKPAPSSFDSTKLSAYHDVSSTTQVKMQPFEPDYAYSKKTGNSHWRILSPGVEIYKSKSLATIPSEPQEDSKRFDHAKAIGRSIGFDYTNVVDPKPYNYESDEMYTRNVNTKPEENRNYNNYVTPNENREKLEEPLPMTLITNPNIVKHSPLHHLNVDYAETQQDGAGHYENVATPEEDMSYFPENYRNGFKTVLRSESQQNFDTDSKYNTPSSLHMDFSQDGAEHRENIEQAGNSNSGSNYKSNIRTFDSTSEVVDTRFLEQDDKPNVPVFRQKQIYQPFPLVDYPPTQKYIKTRAPVYSVPENPQKDNMQHYSQLIYNYNKLPSRNTHYIPQNHRFYSGIKRVRPTSFLYSKEPKKYMRPHGRNKLQSRIH